MVEKGKVGDNSDAGVGVSYLSWLYNEIFLSGYAEGSSVEDELSCAGTKACAVNGAAPSRVLELY